MNKVIICSLLISLCSCVPVQPMGTQLYEFPSNVEVEEYYPVDPPVDHEYVFHQMPQPYVGYKIDPPTYGYGYSQPIYGGQYYYDPNIVNGLFGVAQSIIGLWGDGYFQDNWHGGGGWHHNGGHDYWRHGGGHNRRGGRH